MGGSRSIGGLRVVLSSECRDVFGNVLMEVLWLGL